MVDRVSVYLTMTQLTHWNMLCLPCSHNRLVCRLSHKKYTGCNIALFPYTLFISNLFCISHCRSNQCINIYFQIGILYLRLIFGMRMDRKWYFMMTKQHEKIKNYYHSQTNNHLMSLVLQMPLFSEISENDPSCQINCSHKINIFHLINNSYQLYGSMQFALL